MISTLAQRIAKITDTFLGIEDHGIFTAILDCDYGGSGQGVGTYALDSYDPTKGCRIGTAAGMEFIRRIMSACGVSSWEKIKGRTILVYFESEAWNSKVIGIGPLPVEGGTPFLFAEWLNEYDK